VSRTPEENEHIVKEGFVDKARRTLGRVPFSDEAVAAYYCAKDPMTPTSVKVTVMAALAYFVIPTDAIPDFIAMLGFTDDAAVFWIAWRTISAYVTTDHRDKAKLFWQKDNNDQGPRTKDAPD
tara:strand:+ start:585 stop:953 length:369 start_codon:yes stop_codon:yes gene_type:complete